MSRFLVILRTASDRAKAMKWLAKAPEGYRIEFKEPKRSTQQNDFMWALLSDVAAQKTHFGQKYPPETWKSIFMAALGRECQFVPALDGQGVIPLGMRSSDLAVKEMVELIDFIQAWGAQNGVKFNEESEAA